MPLKKVRKNSTAAGKVKIIGNNMAILFAANAKKPKSRRLPVDQIRAAAFNAAGVKTPKRKK